MVGCGDRGRTGKTDQSVMYIWCILVLESMSSYVPPVVPTDDICLLEFYILARSKVMGGAHPLQHHSAALL